MSAQSPEPFSRGKLACLAGERFPTLQWVPLRIDTAGSTARVCRLGASQLYPLCGHARGKYRALNWIDDAVERL